MYSKKHFNSFRAAGNTSQADDLSRPLSPPIGSLFRTLSITDISNVARESRDEEPAEITSCEYIASYNWMESKTPTVVVPGAPACLLHAFLADFYRCSTSLDTAICAI